MSDRLLTDETLARLRKESQEGLRFHDLVTAYPEEMLQLLDAYEENRKLNAIIDATDAARRFVASNPANLQPLLNFLRGLP